MKIQIINGPNLNLLGMREPDLYGTESFPAIFEKLQRAYPKLSWITINRMLREIINKIHEAGFDSAGIILNAGGYTHTSVAIRDAIKAVKSPVIEVHISNVYSREPFRHQSIIAPVCAG